MPRDDEARLLDMLLACRKAMAFCNRKTWEEFIEDEQMQFAVLHCISIIGEAAWAIAEKTRRSHDAIPWGEIRGMRNRIQHEYFAINLPIVWEVVQSQIPQLREQLTLIVPEPDEDDLFSA